VPDALSGFESRDSYMNAQSSRFTTASDTAIAKRRNRKISQARELILARAGSRGRCGPAQTDALLRPPPVQL
jgi:hypothetical protein